MDDLNMFTDIHFWQRLTFCDNEELELS